MKIVFCIKKLSGISGGAEWVLASVANGLASRGHEVYVISFDNEREKSFYEFSRSVELINLGEGEFSFLELVTKIISKLIFNGKEVLVLMSLVFVGLVGIDVIHNSCIL